MRYRKEREKEGDTEGKRDEEECRAGRVDERRLWVMLVVLGVRFQMGYIVREGRRGL